jgi:hypothetical protein
MAILIESQNYWPRTERLLIGLHTTPSRARGDFHSLRAIKIMNHFVVKSLLGKFARAAQICRYSSTKQELLSLSISYLRGLRVLGGEMLVTILVAVLPR